MNRFQDDPLEIVNYFDLPLIRRDNDDSDNTILEFYVTNTVTGEVIIGATVVLTLATGEVLTQQTDLNGKVEFTIEGLTQPVQATVEFSATGFDTRTESGPILPGEDVDGAISLTPTPPSP